MHKLRQNAETTERGYATSPLPRDRKGSTININGIRIKIKSRTDSRR
jgi:hypothetical protein